ncbi:hypothetical protein [Marivirga sp.]|uniref:hypothetical protein n=1 Tax=Marivirga sp. TaxID=2018662 RepID=UPI0025FDB3F0|nr:hypothetical protein [Marivirga sp.]
MDKLIQIATQELGQKEISGDRHSNSPKPGDVVIYWYESRQPWKGSFRQLSTSQLLNLPEPTLERIDKGGNSDPEKNPPSTSAISNMKRSETTWIELVTRHGIIELEPEANLLEAKSLKESEKAFNDVKINSDGSDGDDVIE